MKESFVVEIVFDRHSHRYEVRQGNDEDGLFYFARHICVGHEQIFPFQIKPIEQWDGSFKWVVNDITRISDTITDVLGLAIEGHIHGIECLHSRRVRKYNSELR
jgi:hypothetical protein